MVNPAAAPAAAFSHVHASDAGGEPPGGISGERWTPPSRLSPRGLGRTVAATAAHRQIVREVDAAAAACACVDEQRSVRCKVFFFLSLSGCARLGGGGGR